MPVHDWTRVDAGVFHSFHTTWLALLAIRLNQVLPAEYYALAEGRAFGLGPDILTLGRGRPDEGNGSGHGPEVPERAAAAGGLTLTASPPKVELVLSRPAPHRQRAIFVRRTADDRVVAVVEVVSPGNKGSRSAIQAFVAKALEFVDRGVNLLVIDLFPRSPRDPVGIHSSIWGAYAEIDEPSPPGRPLTLAAYAAGDVERAFVQTVSVGDPLPDMPLVLEADQYVSVPLEATYMAAFEGFPVRWREVLTAIGGGG